MNPVFLFVPNLVGYARVVLAAAGIYCMGIERLWMHGAALYFVAFACDALDGIAARHFDQCSTFGAVLDMVTDRCSTAALFVTLAGLYPQFQLAFIFLLVLDFASHWIQMVSAKGHHKDIGEDRNLLVRLFYNVYLFFGYCCVGTELFYIMLVVLRHLPDAAALGIRLDLAVAVTLAPAFVCKQVVNVAQLCSASAAVAKEDLAQRTAAKSK